MPHSLHLFSDQHRERTLVFSGQSIEKVVTKLGAEVSHLLIEGGAQVITQALAAGLVNEVAFFIAPAAMGTTPRALGRLPIPLRLREVSYRRVGPDILCRGLV